MPFFDPSTGQVVTRIVYDGAPEAGKSSNVRIIADQVGDKRSGQLWSPRTPGRRTEFFDWVEFSGGLLDGHRIVCQVLSVPGQPELAHRRRMILETADVIVFVVDSRSEHVDQARKSLDMTREIAKERCLSLIIQANKQDLIGALEPIAVQNLLGSDGSVSVLGSCCESGNGVMLTFVMAARSAVDLARHMLRRGDLAAESAETSGAEALLESMLRGERANGPSDLTHPELVDAELEQDLKRPHFPDPARIGIGHVWPPQCGRQFFAQATLGSPRAHTAFIEHIEVETISTSGGWRLQTFPSDDFSEESSARHSLVVAARQCQTYASWIDPTLAIAIYPRGSRWRLWTVVRRRPSLREALVATRERTSQAELLERIARFESAIADRDDGAWLCERACLDGLALVDEQIVLQTVRYPGGASQQTPLHELARRITGSEAAHLPSRSPS